MSWRTVFPHSADHLTRHHVMATYAIVAAACAAMLALVLGCGSGAVSPELQVISSPAARARTEASANPLARPAIDEAPVESPRPTR